MTNAELGRSTEARFLLDAMAQGLTVSRPFCEAAGYDAVVERRGKMLRVQVKAARPTMQRSRRRVRSSSREYRINANRHRRADARQYDIMALWLHEDSAWVFMSRRHLGNRRVIVLTVGGKKPRLLNDWSLFHR